jgi:hypothetical protein
MQNPGPMKLHKLINQKLSGQKQVFHPVTLYEKLNANQKESSAAIFLLKHSSLCHTIFSIEDIANLPFENIIYDSDIFETTNYLVARFIPSGILVN